MIDKSFRVGDAVGPDYRCSKCGLCGFRLWRQFSIMLETIDLLCAVCAEADQVKQIERYKEFHRPYESTIGDLLPARPTPEGSTFWGQTSGDIVWWYRLPQYVDEKREAERCRIERDHFIDRADEYGERWIEERQENYKLVEKIKELISVGGK